MSGLVVADAGQPFNITDSGNASQTGLGLDRADWNTSHAPAYIGGKLNAAAASGISDFLLFGFFKSSGLRVAKVPYRDILQAPGRAELMGQKAFARIAEWSFEQDIQGLRQALAHVAPGFEA